MDREEHLSGTGEQYIQDFKRSINTGTEGRKEESDSLEIIGAFNYNHI